MALRADLIIVDGKNLLWRTHDVDSQRFSRDRTMAIGGAEGFIRQLLKLRKVLGGAIVVAWEGVGRNWRLDIDPAYKANRNTRTPEQQEQHEAVTRQIPLLQELLSRIGVRQFQGLDCEGDDVMATLVARALSASHEALEAGSPRQVRVAIYSRDRDLLQLVSDAEGVFQVMPEGASAKASVFCEDEAVRCDLGRVMSEVDVAEVMGVPAAMIPDLKGLAGDTGDNIPGVRGIGPGKATPLILEFGDLDKILNAAADGKLEGKRRNIRNKLLDNLEVARRCKVLASVKRDANIEEIKRNRSEDEAHVIMFKLGMTRFTNTADFAAVWGLGS